MTVDWDTIVGSLIKTKIDYRFKREIINSIVLHSPIAGTAQATLNTFITRGAVAHYIVSRVNPVELAPPEVSSINEDDWDILIPPREDIWPIVHPDLRVQHAQNNNSNKIGIEIVNFLALEHRPNNDSGSRIWSPYPWLSTKRYGGNLERFPDSSYIGVYEWDPGLSAQVNAKGFITNHEDLKEAGTNPDGYKYIYWEPYPWEQLGVVIDLLSQLTNYYSIDILNIISHSSLSPTAKNDPGPAFPMQDIKEVISGSVLKEDFLAEYQNNYPIWQQKREELEFG